MTAGPVCRAFALALVLPLLGGCFVTSENPVLRPGEDGRDPALRGLWVTEEGREFLHVLRPELEDGQEKAEEAPGFSGLYIVARRDDADDRDNWARVRMVSTEVNNRKILSMRFIDGEGGGDLDDMPGWLIFAYEIRNGRLWLHMIEDDPIDEAIKAGELAGRTANSDRHVTASGEEWIAFLEGAHLDALFANFDSYVDDNFLVRLPAAEIRSLVEGKEPGSADAP
ncbi:MAG: hypothetical protein ACLFV8_08745 [Alphaproteobacteria bacterium]